MCCLSVGLHVPLVARPICRSPAYTGRCSRHVVVDTRDGQVLRLVQRLDRLVVDGQADQPARRPAAATSRSSARRPTKSAAFSRLTSRPRPISNGE